MPSENEPAVRAADAGVPADQGLASLGMLMQLAGSLAAAGMALAMFGMLFAVRGRDGSALWLFLVLGLCIARSLYHRMAGTQLLYGRGAAIDGVPQRPLGGIHAYLIVSLVQTAGTAFVMLFRLEAPGKIVLGMVLALLAWPLTLGILLATPRFRRFARALPITEDKGFEGAAILMTILGLCGAIGTGLVLFVMLERGGQVLVSGPGVMLTLALIALLIRSGLHVQAGLSGLRETSIDRAVELANRYANFGVISSFCAAGGLLLTMLTARFDISGFSMVAGLAWMLLAWPLILRRFFSERHFADLMLGDHADAHRRAPDAGLTSLGWLLLGYAAFQAMLVIPQLVGGAGLPGRLEVMTVLSGPVDGARSIWWSVGAIMLQVWAGLELVRMTPHHRIVGIVYGVGATAVTAYLYWPVLRAIGAVSLAAPEVLLSLPAVTIQLVLSIATILLVTRKIAPTARARFRTRAAPVTETPTT